ncbi:hypothetical protein [Niallia taxi]|uniref:hypothetical protein n=1 Tax=Niallia taxi TaxID=2499688 RepID=UPI00300B14E4
MGKMDEIIIVAPRDVVFENESLTFQGVNSDELSVKKIVDNISSSYSEMRRGDAEENELFKQPIPYCVLKRGYEFYVYKRLTGGGETRLHNQLSLGVGGHMNDTNRVTFQSLMMDNLQRELDEELNIQTEQKFEFNVVGLINDDLNEVGKVHVGLLVVAELPLDAEVTVRETDQLEGFWVNIKDLKDVYKNLESWSQYISDLYI